MRFTRDEMPARQPSDPVDPPSAAAFTDEGRLMVVFTAGTMVCLTMILARGLGQYEQPPDVRVFARAAFLLPYVMILCLAGAGVRRAAAALAAAVGAIGGLTAVYFCIWTRHPGFLVLLLSHLVIVVCGLYDLRRWKTSYFENPLVRAGGIAGALLLWGMMIGVLWLISIT